MLGWSLLQASTAAGKAPLDYKNIVYRSLIPVYHLLACCNRRNSLHYDRHSSRCRLKKCLRRKEAPPKPFQKPYEKANKTVTQARGDAPGGPRRTEVCACLSWRLLGANRPCCDWNNPSRNVCLHRSAHSPK